MDLRKIIPMLAVVGLVAFAAQAGPDDLVYFPDANLKQAVKDALGITTDPTESDMGLFIRINGRRFWRFPGVPGDVALFRCPAIESDDPVEWVAVKDEVVVGWVHRETGRILNQRGWYVHFTSWVESVLEKFGGEKK